MNGMLGKRTLGIGVCILAVLLAGARLVRTARAEEQEWPLAIESGGARILLYQPQPESFQGDKLTARAAVSVERQGEAEPSFGAIWIDARVSTDRDARTVTILDMQVPKVRFPNATPEQESELVKVLQAELPKQRHTFSLDRLLTTLDEAAQQESAASGLEHAPPRIVFASRPTVLVTLDGKPKLQAIEGSKVIRVVNTPFVILFDPASKKYFLRAVSIPVATAGKLVHLDVAERALGDGKIDFITIGRGLHAIPSC